MQSCDRERDRGREVHHVVKNGKLVKNQGLVSKLVWGGYVLLYDFMRFQRQQNK